ncbi:mechanosensitive ion channel family protein [Acinetobacter sp. ANC 4558]|uniref:mechanosensitive ion channel family protein n=1 Tax=Acinetobacter sp. ANC 4558 TaxID=1977876 RepID=UPI0026A4B345
MKLLERLDELKLWIDHYPWLDMLTSLSIVIITAILANFIAKHIIVRGLHKAVSKVSFSNKKVFLTQKLISRLANIVPAIIMMHGIVTVPYLSPDIVSAVKMIAQASIFLSFALAISELLNIFNNAYQRNPNSKSKPIKGYLQLIKLIIFLVCALMIVGTFLQRDVFTLLASFGAMTAILMLVFQNTLLSIVASIQISSYDMIRIGDWITMPSLNADGDVIDMSLHTITIQNFDNTYSTIPTNKIVTDSFINWRGMSVAGVRRIKRSLQIDQFSVHFVDDEMLDKLKNFLLLNQYLNAKTEELDKFNQHLSNHSELNQRRLSNLGTFRAYVEFYLQQHPGISKEATCMVRQLQPTSEGLPLEIYAFANTTVWKDYENIQSDIFDHLISILPEFELKIYQEP